MKKNILILLVGLITGTTLTATAAYVYTARDINYQPSDENWSVNNVQEALSELKSDVNNINNKVEGIERVYKAGEVELVALVSDDSFYKDSNDKYVLSNSDTGRSLLANTSTYKSLASTSDCVGIVGQDVVTFAIGYTEVSGDYQFEGNDSTVSINIGFKPDMLIMTADYSTYPNYYHINYPILSDKNKYFIDIYGSSGIHTVGSRGWLDIVSINEDGFTMSYHKPYTLHYKAIKFE